ncbi:sporulation integral membrane protein YlbJ [Serpentinicella sp. ANB-PHB4]|uniref:sporulation integral membrane protein YlbJ n=1 Tax=Serpentinicella sp. ANB-PHB4 TaxID=3074076 RepID=UPI002864B795|nr:sporulation integral membrane protein YlbJ [Serpentinicella sp. ANB-PHB4]MDR5658305.1 sporulation integral membrane protein YlbJ [Serpentinicella sp. ANB-PHB4]
MLPVMVNILVIFLIFFLIIFIKRTFYIHRAISLFVKYLPILSVLTIVICIVLLPSISVNAAYNGLQTWFSVVVPALLPFFIGSELLIRLGVIKFIGSLLEVVMRPIFNVPGAGSFAFTMSITSGYPIGAKIVSKLRLDNEISRIEGQRLIAFCSTSGPLFMIGAVAVGMFKSAEIGLLIAMSHYLAILLIGIGFRFYKFNETKEIKSSKYPSIKKAFKDLDVHNSHSEPFGVQLGSAVSESFSTMFIIGGFIILFSVIIDILTVLGLITFLSSLISSATLPIYELDKTFVSAFLTGFFEITTGCKLISETAVNISLKIAAASFIIAWSGFSIHAQCISIISKTDISSNIYLLSKLLHGFLAGFISFTIYSLFPSYFAVSTGLVSYYNYLSISEKFFFNFFNAVQMFISVVVVFLILSIIVHFIFLLLDKITKG